LTDDSLSAALTGGNTGQLRVSLEGLLAGIAALLCFLAFVSSAFAEETDNSIAAEQKDLGRIQTEILWLGLY
jgi:hypothetical protein